MIRGGKETVVLGLDPSARSHAPGKPAAGARAPRQPVARGAARSRRLARTGHHRDGPGRHTTHLRRAVYAPLTIRCDGGAHGGNPPPHQEEPRRQLPPSGSLSSAGENGVNGRSLRLRGCEGIGPSPRKTPHPAPRVVARGQALPLKGGGKKHWPGKWLLPPPGRGRVGIGVGGSAAASHSQAPRRARSGSPLRPDLGWGQPDFRASPQIPLDPQARHQMGKAEHDQSGRR
jgi:hypothetical protein